MLLRRTLRAELALGLVALAATGALSSYAPSVAESSGPYATSVNVGPARVEVTVDPAKVGPNQLHLYLFDAKTGAPFEQTEELTVSAEMPEKQIAKIALVAARRRPRPLRRRRRQPRRGGRVDDPHRHPRLRLRPVRDPLPVPIS